MWDYLAAVMIVREAGGVAADALGRELVTLDHDARRRPVTAAIAAVARRAARRVSRDPDRQPSSGANRSTPLPSGSWTVA